MTFRHFYSAGPVEAPTQCRFVGCEDMATEALPKPEEGLGELEEAMKPKVCWPHYVRLCTTKE